MVRPKLQLERLNGELSREHYYLHHRSIVSKKVREMSVLTGTDVLFLAFSPAGIPTLHLGQYSNLVNVMRRFSGVSFNDREKRRLDNLQTLKANYQKDQYNVDVYNLFHAWKVKRLQEMGEELATLKKELSSLNQIKSCWENPERVNSIEKIKEMEARLQMSLEEIRNRKNELIRQEMTMNADAAPAVPVVVPSPEPFENYLPEMLPGNDELLAYAKMLMDEDEEATSKDKNQ